MSFDARYLRGIDHFNRGAYFEAHEVWEDLWIEVNDERKGFYLGLIQAAVALHHGTSGNPGGCRSLYRRSRAQLDGYVPSYEGIDVAAFVAGLERACAPAFAEPPGPVDTQAVPHLALE